MNHHSALSPFTTIGIKKITFFILKNPVYEYKILCFSIHNSKFQKMTQYCFTKSSAAILPVQKRMPNYIAKGSMNDHSTNVSSQDGLQATFLCSLPFTKRHQVEGKSQNLLSSVNHFSPKHKVNIFTNRHRIPLLNPIVWPGRS